MIEDRVTSLEARLAVVEQRLAHAELRVIASAQEITGVLRQLLATTADTNRRVKERELAATRKTLE